MFCRTVIRSSPLFPVFSRQLDEVTGYSGKTSAISSLFAAQPVGNKLFEVTGFPGQTSASDNLIAAEPISDKLSGASGLPAEDSVLLNSFTDDGSLSNASELYDISFPTLNKSSHRNKELFCNTIQLLNPIVEGHLRSLVSNTENQQRQAEIYSLLTRFSRTFDVTKHNIARTTIHHVINTVPHSPPACRPYLQPDKEEAMHTLVQEFLQD